MNFFKQAQTFAASAGGNQDGSSAPGDAPTTDSSSGGGIGSFLGEAQSLMNSQSGNTPADTSSPPVALPGGHTPPTTSELMQSTQLLFGAAQGQKVDNQQLAGAASDLLGGLASYGKLDQGQYSSYIDQAEGYLNKYSGENAAGGAPSTTGGAPPAHAPAKDATAPPTDTTGPTDNTGNAPTQTSAADQVTSQDTSAQDSSYTGGNDGSGDASGGYGQQPGSPMDSSADDSNTANY